MKRFLFVDEYIWNYNSVAWLLKRVIAEPVNNVRFLFQLKTPVFEIVFRVRRYKKLSISVDESRVVRFARLGFRRKHDAPRGFRPRSGR